jgi:predicted dinucleotide-utilizing enzyme
MNKIFKVGLIGCGHISEHILEQKNISTILKLLNEQI